MNLKPGKEDAVWTTLAFRGKRAILPAKYHHWHQNGNGPKGWGEFRDSTHGPVIVHQQAGNKVKCDILLTEARARIIWGEPASSVRAFLVSNGMSESEADVKIKEFCAERNAELRSIGVRNTLIGAVLLAGAGATFCLCFKLGLSSGLARAAAFCLAGIFYGIWKLYKGIIYLVRPQSEHKSIPDITQSDILD